MILYEDVYKKELRKFVMEKISLFTMMKNLKKNFLLLLSTVVALCLFLSPSLISLLLLAFVFIVVLVFALLDRAKPFAISDYHIRAIAVLLTLLISFMGYNAFRTTWTPSSKIAALADALHLSKTMFILSIGLFGCIVGFYAMYIFSCWSVILVTRLLKEKLPEQRKFVIIANLKRNWYFPISAMAFFSLSATLTFGYFVGLLIALVASMVVSSQIPSIWLFIKKNCIGYHIISIFTAIGICWGGQASCYVDLSDPSKAQALEPTLSISIDSSGFLSVFSAIIAVFFVYFCVLIFWREMTRIIVEAELFKDIKFAELIVYAVLLMLSLVFITISFSQTEAFYRGEYAYDIIYTSDSPFLLKSSVYLTLTHPENDLRQPLFAVFAAPFIGIPYLIGRLFAVSASVQAILVNCVQVVMLFVANFILTKMMKLSSVKRICFILLTYCTYTHLLFVLMMEQYIVAYFWMVLCLYLICQKQQPDRIALWGAGGTLMTSMILLPFMSKKNPLKNFKEWLKNMVEYGLEFVGIMLAFCRFDVIYNLTTKIFLLSHFTGHDLTIMDKVYQYTEFVHNCFAAPDAGVNFTATYHVSWQLNTVLGINFVGVVILLLAIVSTVLNRDKKSSLLAGGWVFFSVIILFVLGWGTEENGLILYALYFGWAFLVLLFQLVEKIESRLNVRFLIPVLSVGCAVVLAAINIPAIIDMVDFAIAYFPV